MGLGGLVVREESEYKLRLTCGAQSASLKLDIPTSKGRLGWHPSEGLDKGVE